MRPPTTPLPPTRSRSGSVLPWQILSAFLAIALIAAVIVTLTNSDNGTQWKTRATTAESLAEQLQTKFDESEKSAKTLQARTVKLAAEKADAEDKAKVNSMNVTIAKTLATQLNDCTDRLNTVFGELVGAQSSAEITKIYNTDFRTAFDVCNRAATAADGFSRYLTDNENS